MAQSWVSPPPPPPPAYLIWSLPPSWKPRKLPPPQQPRGRVAAAKARTRHKPTQRNKTVYNPFHARTKSPSLEQRLPSSCAPEPPQHASNGIPKGSTTCFVCANPSPKRTLQARSNCSGRVKAYSLAVLRFRCGDKPLNVQVVCPQTGPRHEKG